MKDKNIKNLKASTAILEKNNISFESFNNGVHLKIKGVIDFWPSTGLFIDTISNYRDRGVNNLIKYVNSINFENKKTSKAINPFFNMPKPKITCLTK